MSKERNFSLEATGSALFVFDSCEGLGGLRLRLEFQPVAEASRRRRRPVLLTIICVFAIIGAVVNLCRVAFGPPSKLGTWFLPSLDCHVIFPSTQLVDGFSISPCRSARK